MELNQICGFANVSCAEREKVQTFYSNDRAANVNLVMMVTAGSICFEFVSGKVLARAGDVLVWDSDKLKVAYPASKESVTYLIVKFEMLSTEGKKVLVSDLSVPHLIREKDSRKIYNVLKKMAKQYVSRDLLRKYWCASHCFELMHLVYKPRVIVGGKSNSVKSIMDYRILKAIDYIFVNYKKHITVPKLAKLAYMNADYFTRLFKKCTGITPAEYINVFKINKAKDFLLLYDEPLAFTATDLGFHDYSHFSRTFKKVTGITPGQFIKQSPMGYKPKQDKWNC